MCVLNLDPSFEVEPSIGPMRDSAICLSLDPSAEVDVLGYVCSTCDDSNLSSDLIIPLDLVHVSSISWADMCEECDAGFASDLLCGTLPSDIHERVLSEGGCLG
jgi:hypothetical protein